MFFSGNKEDHPQAYAAAAGACNADAAAAGGAADAFAAAYASVAFTAAAAAAFAATFARAASDPAASDPDNPEAKEDPCSSKVCHQGN